MNLPIFFVLLWAVSCVSFVRQHSGSARHRHRALSERQQQQSDDWIDTSLVQRRDVLASAGAAMTVFLVGGSARADEEADSFAAIAARASKISKEIDKENAQIAATVRKSEKTAYDFELPVDGETLKFADVIKQEFFDDGVKVKAILVVNIKQDDPVARKTIPELISLATKYGRNRDGALAVVCCPTYVAAKEAMFLSSTSAHFFSLSIAQ